MNSISGSLLGPSAYPSQGGIEGSGQKAASTVNAASGAVANKSPTVTEPDKTALELDPSQIKDRINSLIDNQFKAGQITSDQADVLREVLSPLVSHTVDAATNVASETSDNALADKSSGATANDGARPSPSETLASFIQQVQRSQVRTVGYGNNGARASDLTSSKLLDFNT